VVDRADDGRIVFPYDEVHVDFVLPRPREISGAGAMNSGKLNPFHLTFATRDGSKVN